MKPGYFFLLTVLLLSSAFLLLQPRASADLPQFDGGDSSGVSLIITFDYTTDLFESGTTLQIEVIVTDHHGMRVSSANVKILADGGTATPSSGVTSDDGRFLFTYSATARVERQLLVVATASKMGTYGATGRIVVVVVPPVNAGGIQIPVAPAAGFAVIASIGAASTEWGKYSLFKFLVFPLYSRMKKEQVLDHFVRGQIYGYIRANPGVHFNLLRGSLKLNNGSLAHHLRTLEMQGFVRSRRDGMFKRFYPIDVKVPSEEGIKLSDLQSRILEMVSNGDGTSQSEIASRLNVSQQAVSYNLRQMSHEGMVAVERAGRERRYFVAET